jgi:hypothetical protein
MRFLLLALLCLPHFAVAAGPFHAPKYPLEPGKRPVEVIDQDTYVEGATKPPEPVIPVLAPRPDNEVSGQSRFGMSLCYDSTSSDGEFVGTSSTKQLSRTSTLPLCAEVRAFLRPPHAFFGFRGQGSFGTGSAAMQVNDPTIPNADATVTEYRAQAEILGFLWSRRSGDSLYELSLSAGGAWISSSVAQLRLATLAASVDARQILAVPAGVSFRISPDPNWFAELTYRRFFWMSAKSGTGDAQARNVSHSQIELEASRLISPQWAILIGARYDWRSMHWVMTTPETQDHAFSSSQMVFSFGLSKSF